MKTIFSVLLFFTLFISTNWNYCSISNPLDPPQLISPPNGSCIISDTLFDWTPVTGAASYYIQFTLGLIVVADSTVAVDSLRMNFSGGPGLSQIYWRVRANDQQGPGPYSEIWSFTVLPNGIQKISENIPENFYLYNNYPNPFNIETVIEFDIPSSISFQSSSIPVKLQVFGILGGEKETLIDKNLPPGKYRIKWNADKYSSGLYFCRLSADSYSMVRKMVLIK